MFKVCFHNQRLYPLITVIEFIVDHNAISAFKSTVPGDLNYNFGFQTQLCDSVPPGHLTNYEELSAALEPAKALLELYLDNCALVLAQRRAQIESHANTGSPMPKQPESTSDENTTTTSVFSKYPDQQEIDAWLEEHWANGRSSGRVGYPAATECPLPECRGKIYKRIHTIRVSFSSYWALSDPLDSCSLLNLKRHLYDHFDIMRKYIFIL